MAGKTSCMSASVLAVAVLAVPVTARAQQRSAENAVASADDAFGSQVGLESTGIYSQELARGFSPIQAGNVRLDGIYFDPVALVTFRILESQAIRVGYAALDYPFPAPTGIVDDRLRTAGNDFSVGVGIHRQQYGSFVTEADVRIPIVKDHLALMAGVSQGAAQHIDGATGQNVSWVFKPVARWRGVELSPFYSANYLFDNRARPLIIAAGGFIPELPQAKLYYGSPWAKASFENVNYGATLKARITDRLSLRAGLFNSSILRKANYTETFAVLDRSGKAAHRVIADPRQELHSWSGEAQLAYRFGSESAQHRVIAGFRGRDRTTEFGGSDQFSDVRSFPAVDVDEALIPEPRFAFSPVNTGKIRQTSWLLGYLGKVAGLGQVNLGLQRTDFRGRSVGAAAATGTREKHWLYNASLAFDLTRNLTILGGTQRGLEDSGAAPENAVNRNEQLPPRKSTQYEAGLRWKFASGQLLVSAFEISKPYFSFDAGGRFTRLGTVRHRGVEASVSGHFFKDRLNLLAGAVVMKPRVTGPGRDLGLVGKRPVGTRPVRVRLDATYRAEIWKNLTPTLNVTYQSKTAAGSQLLDRATGRQLMLPASTSIDIGFRKPLMLGRFPATLRGKVENVFDQRRWTIIASNTLQPADHRRFGMALLVDF